MKICNLTAPLLAGLLLLAAPVQAADAADASAQSAVIHADTDRHIDTFSLDAGVLNREGTLYLPLHDTLRAMGAIVTAAPEGQSDKLRLDFADGTAAQLTFAAREGARTVQAPDASAELYSQDGTDYVPMAFIQSLTNRAVSVYGNELLLITVDDSKVWKKLDAYTAPDNSLRWPADSSVISSPYGWRTDPVSGGYSDFHLGIDIAAPAGSPVYAAQSGTVTFTQAWDGSTYGMMSYGNCVDITGATGLLTRYGHLSQVLVSPEQTVSRGDIIGYVGATGNVTGAHLHFETRVNGSTVDPRTYVNP